MIITPETVSVYTTLCHTRLYKIPASFYKGVTTSRGEEEKIEIRVVSGETNLILHVETYQL